MFLHVDFFFLPFFFFLPSVASQGCFRHRQSFLRQRDDFLQSERDKIGFTRDRFCYLFPQTPEVSKWMRRQNDLSPEEKLMVEHCCTWGWRERSNMYMKFFQYEQFFTCQKSISCAILLSAHLPLLAPFSVDMKPWSYRSQWICHWNCTCLCQQWLWPTVFRHYLNVYCVISS